MKITKEIVEKTAHLARLEFDDVERDKMIHELQQMVDWMDQLYEVDTEGVEPLTNMSYEINVLRKDKKGSHLLHQETFKNAPEHNGELFKVPKVINK
ncbi:MAG: Asp-tRNA(Asn)/Glu-tRNA(Gln) amidotransferase subunit GatC [Ekhidna sp.]|nr:Asp-tRNA(Asn)/Glu-tRNA(Gln) amidotransferase subunit GatC [Ekhidna sp.]